VIFFPPSNFAISRIAISRDSNTVFSCNAAVAARCCHFLGCVVNFILMPTVSSHGFSSSFQSSDL
jgi:hypothetical protein